MSLQVYRDDILKPIVGPWIDRGEDFCLEEDGDSGHGKSKNNIVRKWKEERGLEFFFNCPQSLDLSPIENCWQVPKQYVKKFPVWDDQGTRELVVEGVDQYSQAHITHQHVTTQHQIRIVADGIFSFGPQTHDDNIFTLKFLIKSLQRKNGPLDPLTITLDTAHRDGEILDDGSPPDQNFPFPKASFATIPGKFRFAGPLFAGEVTRPLETYDEIWLFGYNGLNGGTTLDPRYADMTAAEIVAITTFMNQGATTRIGNLFETRRDTQNQSDDQPQVLHPTALGLTHPILQTSFGTLKVMPDHQHEGEVYGFGRSSGALPYSVVESLAYVGPDFADSLEYPFHHPVERRPYRENPQILATGVCAANHITTKSKPNRVFGVGRVVTDSSFHHYLDLNLLGDPCADSALVDSEVSGFQQKPEILEQMAQFYRNLALYLSGPPLIPLVCTGNTTANRRVYSLEGNNKVNEFSVGLPPHLPVWSMNTITNNSPRQGSALASWTSDNIHNRIYFFDANYRVNELALSSATSTWNTAVIAGTFQQSRPDSGLACTGPKDGAPPKDFFINSSGQVVQLTSTTPLSLSSWTPQVLPGPTAAVSSTLTAQYSATDGISVYYYSSSSIVVVAQSNGLDPWIFNTLVSEGSPSNSNIVSLLVNNIPQIFFADNDQRVSNLTLHNGLWNKTILPGNSRLEGSWLTGYVRNGTEPVLYYVARDGLIDELAWNATSKTWTNAVLSSKVVRTRSQVDCLGFGTHAEVFYTDFKGDVNGMVWDVAKGWANVDLIHPFLVLNPGGVHLPGN
ncbi:MAG: hypothetical protein M1829_006144 [Trizodia sp. TS-e1964]|nr:MAG: hypothetical protein M1829_006144 [Trizodia sp. TS-e1964]